MRLVLSLVTILCIECSMSWILWNSHCYYYSTTIATTLELATAECNNMGSYLVEVDTTDEHNEISQHMQAGSQYRVGLEYVGPQSFVWKHSRQPPFGSLWAPSMTWGGLSVRYYQKSGGWYINDFPDPSNKRFICEAEQAPYISLNITCESTGSSDLEIASGRTSSQSSRETAVSSAVVVDGSLATCSKTNIEKNPWWQVRFDDHAVVTSLTICCGTSLHDLRIELFASNPSNSTDSILCSYYSGPPLDPTTPVEVICKSSSAGQYLRITSATIAYSQLELCDVKINGTYCTTNVIDDVCTDGVTDYRYIYQFIEQSVTQVTGNSSCSNNNANALATVQNTIMPTPTCESSSMYCTACSDLLDVTTITVYSTVTPLTTQSPCSITAGGGSLTSASINTGTSGNMSDMQFSMMIENLKVPRKSTAQYQRTLTSAEDFRPSATAIGWTGVVIIVTYFLVFAFFDIDNIMILKKTKKVNCC